MTLPHYALQHLDNPAFDLIFVDGGHTQAVAASDLFYSLFLGVGR